MFRNSEWYNDPTAGAAMVTMEGHTDRKERSDRRKAQRKKNRQERKARSYHYRNKPKVYVCSPYAGDVARNKSAAIRYCRYVVKKGHIPVAAHLMYPQILDDNDPDERELGLTFGLELLSCCDEVWVFGKEVSPGMGREISEARRIEKPLRYIEEAELT